MKSATANFSYDFYKRILEVAKVVFKPQLFSEAPRILNKLKNTQPALFIRHDIDISPNNSLKIASIESEKNIRSTYMIMINSPFYKIDDPHTLLILNEILAMGHEIGLHFDFDCNISESNNAIDPTIIDQKMNLSCLRLEHILGKEIKSVSFHCPQPQLLKGPFTIAGRINAYSKQLMQNYISDSKGVFRDGNPLTQIKHFDKKLLQLLTHPIWWNEKHRKPEEIIQTFFDNHTMGLSREEKIIFDENMLKQIAIKRTGLLKEELDGRRRTI